MKKKEKLTVTIDKEILNILDKISSDNCVNKSKFINKIIKEYLDKNDIK
jgi:metal-responsive CopG/Arc/MetJ family transcriptional regulator